MQEYTRLAASLTRESTLVPDETQVREAATVIVSALLDKLDVILEKEDGSTRPKLGGQWPRTLATWQRGPPELNRGWYYYGLLDIGSQLTALADPESLRRGFVDRIQQLIIKSETPEYRWKAVSIPFQLEEACDAFPVSVCY